MLILNNQLILLILVYFLTKVKFGNYFFFCNINRIYFFKKIISCASSRIFVHESIYDEFVRLSVEKAKNIKVGDPFDMSYIIYYL